MLVGPSLVAKPKAGPFALSDPYDGGSPIKYEEIESPPPLATKTICPNVFTATPTGAVPVAVVLMEVSAPVLPIEKDSTVLAPELVTYKNWPTGSTASCVGYAPVEEETGTTTSGSPPIRM